MNGLGFARMLGVRDLIFSARRVGGSTANISLAEMDMDNMFWQIPQEDVVESVNWIFSILNGSYLSCKPNSKLRKKEIWFSISKTGDRGLDRVGKSSARTFHIVHEDKVKRFLAFNLKGNSLLSLGTMILQQGKRGVPIGEFLSAQLAEIWCAWREYSSLFAPPSPGENCTSFEHDVRQALHCECKPPTKLVSPSSLCSLPGGGCPRCGDLCAQFCLARDGDYTLASRCARSMGVHGPILISPDVHKLTDTQVCDNGFTGMWAPMDQPFAFLTLGNNTQIALAYTSQWDGAVEGRIQKVIAHTPRRDRNYAREFLMKLDPLQVVMGEIVAPEPWVTPSPVSAMVSNPVFSPSSPPAPTSPAGVDPTVGVSGLPSDVLTDDSETRAPVVLFSRYRDNVYIAFINIPEILSSQVRRLIAIVLQQIYKIPLKWEPHGVAVTWGEASLVPDGTGFSFTRKGIVRDLSLYDPTAPVEWTQWVDRYSPNARTVWRSHFPSVVLKSGWYALSLRDLRLNIRSLIWGMGFHSYPKSWWRPKLYSLWSKYRLGRCFSMYEVDQWAAQGMALSQRTAGEDGSPQGAVGCTDPWAGRAVP